MDYHAEQGKMLLTLIPEFSSLPSYTATASHWRKCWGDHGTAGPAIERALFGAAARFETPAGSNLIRLAKLDDLKEPLRSAVTALLAEDDAVADAAAEVIRQQGWDVPHCYALACRG